MRKNGKDGFEILRGLGESKSCSIKTFEAVAHATIDSLHVGRLAGFLANGEVVGEGLVLNVPEVAEGRIFGVSLGDAFPKFRAPPPITRPKGSENNLPGKPKERDPRPQFILLGTRKCPEFIKLQCIPCTSLRKRFDKRSQASRFFLNKERQPCERRQGRGTRHVDSFLPGGRGAPPRGKNRCNFNGPPQNTVCSSESANAVCH